MTLLFSVFTATTVGTAFATTASTVTISQAYIVITAIAAIGHATFLEYSRFPE